jgi:hypothetical protein
MTEGLPNSFRYEQCDVPDGVPLTEWRRRNAKQDHRRAQVTSGVLAALATLAPIVLSVRGSRRR